MCRAFETVCQGFRRVAIFLDLLQTIFLAILSSMKTTLDLPDDLMRDVKIRAVNENRKLKDMIALLLRRGMHQPPSAKDEGRRVQLPLVQCAHRARPEAEMTPERVADVLLRQDIEREASGRRGSVR